MKSNTSNFGTLDNKEIHLFSLENDNGMMVKLMNYGATITSIQTPDKNGKLETITCGFDSLNSYFSEDYKKNSPYFGGTVGRYTSQIKNAKFELNGETYPLEKNAGDNNLHGGKTGFDKKIWTAEAFEHEDAVGVEMHLVSKSMEEGFPGNVTLSVVFSLNNDNELYIRYHAITDKDTPLSLTNHTYFNLSGFASSVENHSVRIAAGKKLELDATGAATGAIENLNGTADDLRKFKTIGDVHSEMNDGFEHYYLFDKEPFELEKIAVMTCAESGRKLEVSTSEPGMLFYTGKYTSDLLQRESGEKFGKYRGFCCETHRWPNGPNIENSPKSILKKEEEFDSTTIFKFGW